MASGSPAVLDGRSTRDRLGRHRLDSEIRDAELRRVLFERALDGAQNTTIGGEPRRRTTAPRPIVRLEHAPDRGLCPGCGGRYGKHHRVGCALAENAA